jgi:hypothetical protein
MQWLCTEFCRSYLLVRRPEAQLSKHHTRGFLLLLRCPDRSGRSSKPIAVPTSDFSYRALSPQPVATTCHFVFLSVGRVVMLRYVMLHYNALYYTAKNT